MEGDYTQVRRAADDQFYVVRCAANHEVLMTSETYTRHEDAVRAARRVFGDEPITETTEPEQPDVASE